MAARLQDEGAEVLLYTQLKQHRDVGLNLVPRSYSVPQTFAWLKAKPGSIAFYLGSGMGKAKIAAKPDEAIPLGADDLRRAGVTVIAGGSICDRLEKDRIFGEQVAKAMGCRIPPTKEFETISATIAFASTVGDDKWYFKSDRYLSSDATFGGTGEQLVRYLENLRREHGDRVKNILQKAIKGVALSTACWWNGRAFLAPYEATIEHKKCWNDELGPSTGAAISVVWFYEQEAPKVVQSLRWHNLAPMLAKYDAPPGLYDINAIISEEDGEAYFLEWTCRMGWDSEPASLRLLDIPLADFLERLGQGRLAEAPFRTDELSYNIRLSVPPYPFEGFAEDKGSAKGVPIEGIDGLWDGNFFAYSVMANEQGELQVADRWGLIGVMGSTHESLRVCHDDLLDFAKDELEIPALAYRTDGATILAKDAAAIRKLGYEVFPGVLK